MTSRLDDTRHGGDNLTVNANGAFTFGCVLCGVSCGKFGCFTCCQ